MIGGEQGTQIRDSNPSDMIISGYHTRQHATLTWYGYTLYLLRIQLGCPEIYDRDSLDNDCALSHHVDVWIDLNNDGQFDENTERLLSENDRNVGYRNGVHDLSIIIPSISDYNMMNVPHTMRVILNRDPYNRKACHNDGYGEARDYIVQILRHS